ncbi:MAG: prolyl oligopeptidase family serine peptidase [Flavobacterium haoranii]
MFNLQSMYGTTEEVFFSNWDMGGAYWETENKPAQKTYKEFNPINLVNNWNTPILIVQGGKDYRVPTGQALEAFQATQRAKELKADYYIFGKKTIGFYNHKTRSFGNVNFLKWLKRDFVMVLSI